MMQRKREGATESKGARGIAKRLRRNAQYKQKANYRREF